MRVKTFTFLLDRRREKQKRAYFSVALSQRAFANNDVLRLPCFDHGHTCDGRPWFTSDGVCSSKTVTLSADILFPGRTLIEHGIATY